MSQIIIGKAEGKTVHLNVDALLRGRMLVQANSGKGKSWLLRRLAEQLFGKVQVIIIDPEGEFATLREKFGYVLVGKGGETPADPRSAALVAHKLLELRASAVCDIYEMKPNERHAFVHRFLDAMIDSPKNLWHPVVIMLDEAHVYCPEKGAGESEAAESVISMATRGRKRGFCLLPATQRLGKFRKDAAAEMQTVAIGGTFIDVDRKRAADTLGVYGKDVHPFFDQIKLLKRGDFFCLGPAISEERILVTIDGVETTHPEAGSAKHAAEPPPAPERIRAMLPKLSDLPKAAEEEARTVAEFKKTIRELKQQLRSAPVQKVQPSAAKPIVDSRLIKVAVASAVKPYRGLLERDTQAFREIAKVAQRLIAIADRQTNAPAPAEPKIPDGEIQSKGNFSKIRIPEPKRVTEHSRADHPRPDIISHAESNGEGNLTPYQRDILRGLAELEAIGKRYIPRGLAGAAAGKSHKSSTFERYTAALRSQGLIEYHGTKIALTEEGRTQTGDIDESLTAGDVQERLLKILTPYQRDIVQALIAEGGQALSWDEVGEKIGKSAASSTFERYMASLRSSEIIEYDGAKRAKAAAWLFLE